MPYYALNMDITEAFYSGHPCTTEWLPCKMTGEMSSWPQLPLIFSRIKEVICDKTTPLSACDLSIFCLFLTVFLTLQYVMVKEA